MQFKLYKLMSFFILYTVLIMLSGCLPEGYMRTWSTSQDYDHQFKKMMVLGLVNDVALRNQLEIEVVTAAHKTGLSSQNGLSMFPPELGKPFDDVERFKERLRQKDFDGILTITLIDVRAERYVETQEVYEPLGFYNRFGNYYFRTYDLVYKKGYFAQYSRYFIETNLYELKGGTLVWSGRSKVFEPEELDAYAPVYAKGLFKELQIEAIISR